jgi:hypothetical protein
MELLAEATSRRLTAPRSASPWPHDSAPCAWNLAGSAGQRPAHATGRVGEDDHFLSLTLAEPQSSWRPRRCVGRRGASRTACPHHGLRVDDLSGAGRPASGCAGRSCDDDHHDDVGVGAGLSGRDEVGGGLVPGPPPGTDPDCLHPGPQDVPPVVPSRHYQSVEPPPGLTGVGASQSGTYAWTTPGDLGLESAEDTWWWPSK